jgi:hypothetical protein
MEHLSMSEKNQSNLPFDSEDMAEQAIWSALEELPREAPSTDMRRTFYRELERATLISWSGRVRAWLGLSGNMGWITATACVLIGVSVGQMLDGREDAGSLRMAALEENIALLNRELILDRLQDAAAGKRLRGVIDAESVVQGDMEIARALLVRATEDSVQSVRSAAIDALGPSLGSASVGTELMSLLENAESPLVQFALVDLVLRNGTDSQLEYLLELADTGRLHPDLIKHVNRSLGRESV